MDNDEWLIKGHATYHQRILQVTTGESIENFVSDRISESIVAASCETLIPNRDSWIDGFPSQMPTGNCCYTDGSVLGERVGLGLFIEETNTKISFRLTDHNTILQAKVRAITECLNWLNANTRSAIVNVLTDSKIAINTITSKTVTSRTVLECINSINNYSQHGLVRIIWVPGHNGIRGNEIANSLARTGRELAAVNLDNPLPLKASRLMLKTWAKNLIISSIYTQPLYFRF